MDVSSNIIYVNDPSGQQPFTNHNANIAQLSLLAHQSRGATATLALSPSRLLRLWDAHEIVFKLKCPSH